MEWDGCPGSRQRRDFQSFRMRAFIFYSIEMEKVNKTLQYFWGHLNDPVKGFRSKTFPVPPLAGTSVPCGRFYKELKCYPDSGFTL